MNNYNDNGIKMSNVDYVSDSKPTNKVILSKESVQEFSQDKLLKLDIENP